MVDDNALLVLKKRYLIKDVRGNAVETPDQMFERVAGFVARAEEMYGDKGREEIGYSSICFATLSFSQTPPL